MQCKLSHLRSLVKKMAKKHRSNLVTASFHYLVKIEKNEDDPNNPIELPITAEEFQRVVDRISNPRPLNERDEEVIASIKAGNELPFSGYELIDGYVHFGNFDAAYYGQQYRNNLLGVITADSLNLRPFNYLITRLNDGKILIGVTYNGQFGDYDGIRKCLLYILRGNRTIVSRTIKSVSDEIGDGDPVEIKLHYANRNRQAGHRSVFNSAGVIAVRKSEYGENFAADIGNVFRRVFGTVAQRKRMLAQIASEGELLELTDDDIIGCTALIREGRQYRTVYLLGENNFATKFNLNVQVDIHGIPNRVQVRDEMIRIMRERITPLLRR